MDGEGFGEFITNPKLNHEVKLDWWITESDLWVDEEGQFFDTGWVEGIEYDDDNNPIRYKRYRNHPEDSSVMGVNDPLSQDILPAEAVTHWWRVDRPDQRRGMSELAPPCLYGQNCGVTRWRLSPQLRLRRTLPA